MVTRGDVWLAALDSTVGGEIQKTRPCLIVSPDEMNLRLRTMIIVPMTTGSRPAPFRLAVTFKDKPGLLLADQIRASDRTRLVKRLGRLDDAALLAVLKVLGEMFAV